MTPGGKGRDQGKHEFGLAKMCRLPTTEFQVQVLAIPAPMGEESTHQLKTEVENARSLALWHFWQHWQRRQGTMQIIF